MVEITGCPKLLSLPEGIDRVPIVKINGRDLHKHGLIALQLNQAPMMTGVRQELQCKTIKMNKRFDGSMVKEKDPVQQNQNE
ncbi:hypothetical protein F0562_015480 [Nyssa sinensis]|uniref:Uncharacterized protein n=1 Tax=Nyssa sinensis TaxID=561372 RepID=A0A5J4ZKA9_9ASTE|nr:hypothetical protein F0562_015480 [Nyssa sinensis]